MTAVDLIKGFEGCKLNAYQDQGGRWTIGYGATGPGIEAGTKWEQWEADDRLAIDLKQYEIWIAGAVRVPITDNQKAALISFAYNVGIGNFRRSGLLKFLNQHDYAAAADQFLVWDKIGSYVSPGLAKRREKERAVFLTAAGC